MPRALPSHEDILANVGPYRGLRTNRPSVIETPGPGQESVWDFPRPPAVQDVAVPLKVEWDGQVVAHTTKGVRIVETSGAPVYYFPPTDVELRLLVETDVLTICEWKGAAVYFDLRHDEEVSREAAFSYPQPLTDLGQGYERIAGWFGFYAQRVDRVFVGTEQARPQPGRFYAGWVTDALTGPIKGEPGSEGW